MKTYFSGLLVVAALLFCGAALAEAESSDESNVPQQQTEEGAAAEQESAVVAAPKPAVKKYTKFKQTGAERAKDLDLRHCLELENNTAIADCAGE